MTGRLEGTLFGRPVALEADEQGLLLSIADLRSAWRLRRSLATGMLPALRALEMFGLPFRVRVGPGLRLEVMPCPNLLVRLLVPGLSS